MGLTYLFVTFKFAKCATVETSNHSATAPLPSAPD
jgi:hypothetical protein